MTQITKLGAQKTTRLNQLLVKFWGEKPSKDNLTPLEIKECKALLAQAADSGDPAFLGRNIPLIAAFVEQTGPLVEGPVTPIEPVTELPEYLRNKSFADGIKPADPMRRRPSQTRSK